MDTDFAQIIDALRASGYTDALIANICGCSRQYIWQIRTGKVSGVVRHSIGKKLEGLNEVLE